MTINGVVIQIYHYKEYDGIAKILTNKGLLSFVVPNVFKMNNPNIILNLPLLHAQFTFLNSEKNSLIFKEILPISNYFNHMNFIRLIAINFINEIIVNFFNFDILNIYDYLVETIYLINNDDRKILNLMTSFLAISLKLIGLELNTDNYCMISKKKSCNIVGISFLDGGFVCEKYFNENKHKFYSKFKCQILKFLFKMKVNDLKNVYFPKQEIKEILNDLIIYTYYQTNEHFRFEKLIRNFLFKT